MFSLLRRKPALTQAERYAQATQLQLTWWRFKRHKLALISLYLRNVRSPGATETVAPADDPANTPNVT